MNKKRRIVTLIVAMAMFCMMSMSALAAPITEHVYLGSEQVWTLRYACTRTGNYSDVYVKCDSVYPSAGPDYFTKMQVRLVNSSNTVIMDGDYETLTEGEGYKTLTIKQGYLSLNPVYFQFRGNKGDLGAEAIVTYYSN